jgi:hypothetical protein
VLRIIKDGNETTKCIMPGTEADWSIRQARPAYAERRAGQAGQFQAGRHADRPVRLASESTHARRQVGQSVRQSLLFAVSSGGDVTTPVHLSGHPYICNACSS